MSPRPRSIGGVTGISELRGVNLATGEAVADVELNADEPLGRWWWFGLVGAVTESLATGMA